MRLQRPKPNRSDEARPDTCRYTVGAAVGSVGAAAARFDAADFLAAVFLGAGFFFAATGAACDLGAFLTGATAFFAAGFAVFLAALTAFAAWAGAFFVAAGALSAGLCRRFLADKEERRDSWRPQSSPVRARIQTKSSLFSGRHIWPPMRSSPSASSQRACYQRRASGARWSS